jgi:hypothetical protein
VYKYAGARHSGNAANTYLHHFELAAALSGIREQLLLQADIYDTLITSNTPISSQHLTQLNNNNND